MKHVIEKARIYEANRVGHLSVIVFQTYVLTFNKTLFTSISIFFSRLIKIYKLKRW